VAGQTDSHLKAIRPRLLALRRDHRVTAEGQASAKRTAYASPTNGVIDSSLIETLTSDLQSLGLQGWIEQRQTVATAPRDRHACQHDGWHGRASAGRIGQFEVVIFTVGSVRWSDPPVWPTGLGTFPIPR